MKKLSICIFAVTLLSACTPSAKPNDHDAVKSASAVTYTCHMHPKVIANKPGVCPKCGMDLVEKQNEE